MRVWFGGAEVPDHRTTLGRAGVRRVAVNLAPILKQRSGGAGPVETMEPFAALFYASQADLNPEEVDRFLEAYSDDESAFYGLLTPFTERSGRLVPEWLGLDPEEAIEMAIEHGAVGIPEERATEARISRTLTKFLRRNPSVRFFVNSSKVSVLQQAFVTDAIVSGWVSSQRYRELQVWDGTKVVRAGKERRAAALSKFSQQIENLGGDFEAVEDGDVSATTGVAIASWLQYENVVATPHLLGVSPAEGDDDVSVATGSTVVRRPEQVAIPVARLDEDGTMAGVVSGSFRQCDACLLADLCPKFEPGAYCAFTVDVEIRDTDQAMAAMSTLIEIQVQRVQRATFAEEVLGQGPQSSTSAELERVFRMFEAMKRVQENRDTLTIHASSAGDGGVLSKIFGPRVGSANKELSQPVSVDAVIVESGIIDDDDS
jgi:hypothetical protein